MTAILPIKFQEHLQVCCSAIHLPSILFYSILSLSTMFIYLQLSLSIWHFWKETFGAKFVPEMAPAHLAICWGEYRQFISYSGMFSVAGLLDLFFYNSFVWLCLKNFFLPLNMSVGALSSRSLRAVGTHFKRAPPSPLRAPNPCCLRKCKRHIYAGILAKALPKHKIIGELNLLRSVYCSICL
jgi:hypothetical protein